MKIQTSTIFTAILLLCVQQIFAQEKGRNEVGLQAGAMFFSGDLTPDVTGTFKTARPTVSIHYSRILGDYFSVRANLVLGSLSGDDSMYKRPAYMRLRNFRFQSPLAEASLMVQFDIFGTNASVPPTRFSPYVFAGIGASFINPQRDWSRIDTSMIHSGSTTLAGLIRDTMHVPPTVVPVIPVGVGVKYSLTPRWSLITELNYRFSFSDYIDGFSYSANPNKKDGYYTITAGAVYNFGKSASGSGRGGRGSVNCPTVKMFQ